MAAGTIDQLNFEVLLDDSKFNDGVKNAISLANKFNTSLSKLLSTARALPGTKQIISDKGVQNAQNMLTYLNAIEQTISRISSSPKVLVGDADALNATLEKVLDNLEKIVQRQGEHTQEAGKTVNVMRTLSQLTGVVFGVAGIRRFISELVNVSGEFEVQKMALTSMLQSAGRTEVVFRQLRQNALESPYTFMDMTKFAKQLIAFNIDAHKLVDTEKMLADVAAGLGVDMGRIILAYGQIKAAGVLKGQELRQLTEAGVPILEQLAKQIEEVEGKTVSLSEVFSRVSKKQIPFEMVEEAFRRMTAEGGKFYNMQEVLVNTLKGQMGKLRDVWQQSMYDLGQANSGVLKGAVQILIFLAQNLETVVNILAVLIPSTLAYKSAVAIANGALKTLVGSLSGVGLAAAGITAAIAGAIVIFHALHKEARTFYDDLADLQNEQSGAMAQELAQLDHLWDMYSHSAEGSDEFLKAKEALMQAYPEYIRELQAEGVEVNNTANYYDKLRAKIEDSIKARFREKAVQQAQGIFDRSVKDIFGGSGVLGSGLEGIFTAYNNANPNNKLTMRQKEVLRSFLLGTASEGGLYAVGGADFYNFLKTSGQYGTTSYGAGGYANVSNFTSLLDNLKGMREDVQKSQEELKNNLDAIDQIWGKAYTPLGLNAWGNDWHGNGLGGNAKPQAQKDIETMIDTIKALQEAYKDLKAMGLDDDEIFKIFGQEGIFSHVDEAVRTRTDYWKMLGEQAKLLADYDPEAAERLLNDIGQGMSQERFNEWKKQYLEAGKAAKEAATNTNSYREALLSLQATAKGVEGEGFMYDINKALADFESNTAKDAESLRKLEEALNGIDLKQKDSVIAMLMGKGLSEADANKFWDDFVVNGRQAITDLGKELASKTKAAAQNKINSLAGAYIKEAYTLGDIDLSHLGNLSLTQLHQTRDALKDILANISLTDEQKKRIEDAGLSVENFTEAVKKAVEKGIDKLDEAEKKALIKTGKLAFDSVKNLTGALKELGEAAGNDSLSTFADTFGKVASVGESILNGFKQGDWIGAIIAGVASVTSLIIDAVTEQKEAERLLNEAARETARARLSLGLSNTSIFGTNSFADLQDYINKINELERKNMADQTNAYDARKGRGYYTNPYYYLQQKGFRDTVILTDAAKKLGYSTDELYDKWGNLNKDILQAILDNYKYLDDESVQWLKDAIAYTEAYEDAQEKLRDSLQSLFGDIASSAADKIINQWVEAGNAALDYADILDEVAKRYAKMLLENAILDKVLNKEHADELVNKFLSGNGSEAMAIIAEDMQKIADMEPLFTSIMQAVDPYLNKNSDQSNSLGNGFKNITEETASLLASYLNAIRADVSYMRAMQERGWANVELLAGTSVPTLANHLAQIQANTSNSAQHTQDILSELRSVISGNGQTSASVINVQMA